jgi:NNP family nitrate/nitrite transporter-like MFS transporter
MLLALVVLEPGVQLSTLLLVAGVAGVGGGNFASSMANITYFFPQREKGWALGLNAAGGNIGTAVAQFAVPIVVTAGAAATLNLSLAGWMWVPLILVAIWGAWRYMDNLSNARSDAAASAAALREPHLWLLAVLYIGTFGSFIGFASVFPKLIADQFPAFSTIQVGQAAVSLAFLGALVGSVARPLGGWLADRYGGAKVTFGAFVAMIVGTVGVLVTLTRLDPVPVPDPAKVAAWTADPSSFPGFPPAVVAAVDHNADLFPWFLGCFLFVFAATGIGNGSTYRMIPAIWKARARSADSAGSPARIAAELTATKEASAVLGIAGAVGALGGFLIPITFSSPWVDDPVAATRTAFVIFTCFYVVCLAVTWAVYLRPRAAMAKAHV